MAGCFLDHITNRKENCYIFLAKSQVNEFNKRAHNIGTGIFCTGLKLMEDIRDCTVGHVTSRFIGHFH